MSVLINLDKVRDLTNFNPYLVSLLSSVGLERYPQLADHYISKHLCSIFDDMEKFNNLTKFCQMQLENVYEWSRICLNNLPCLTSQLSSFTTLWAAKEHFFLNQARAWFLKITSVRMYACVCVYVCLCVRPRGHE